MKKTIQWWHVAGDVSNVIIAGFILAATASNLAGYKAARIAFLLGGLAMVPGAIVCYIKGNENEPFRVMERTATIETYAEVLSQNPALTLPPSQSEPTDQTTQEMPKFFDWSLIETDPDKYAHLAICGGTGDGKSTLIESLIQYLKHEKFVAIDPHWEPGNYPGIPTVAKGRDYGEWPCTREVSFDHLISGKKCSYTEAISAIETEMDRRYKLRERGMKDWDKITFIFDEYFAFCKNHPNVSKDVVSTIISEARKVDLRLILITQIDTAESMGWKGMAVIKQSLRWVRLGEFAKRFASSTEDELLIQQIKSMKYPIMVEQVPAMLPVPFEQMKIRRNQNVVNDQYQTNSNPPKDERWDIRKHLESIYNLSGDNCAANGEKRGEKRGENFHPSEKPSEKISPNDREGEKPETQTGSGFSPHGENFHLFTEPGFHPSNEGTTEGENKNQQEFTLDEASLVLRLAKQGKGKTEIIKALGYPPGKAYEKGKIKYDQIKAHWEALGLW